MDWNFLLARGCETVDDARKAFGPGGVVGEAAGSFPEVHGNRRGVPAWDAETASHNRVSGQVPISSFLKLRNPASPAGHRIEGSADVSSYRSGGD